MVRKKVVARSIATTLAAILVLTSVPFSGVSAYAKGTDDEIIIVDEETDAEVSDVIMSDYESDDDDEQIVIVGDEDVSPEKEIEIALYIDETADGTGGSKLVTESYKSGTGWKYDATSNTLTLDGFNGSYIGTNEDLTILLKGSNTITMNEGKGKTCAIDTDNDSDGYQGTVTFVNYSNSSTDKLTIQANYASDSVRLANGKFVLEGGSLVLNGKSTTYTIANDSGSFIVKNDANLDVTIDGVNDNTSVGLFELQEDDSSTGTINIRYNSNKGSAVNYFYCYGSGNTTISAAAGANTAQCLELMKKAGTVKFDGELELTNGTNSYNINEKTFLTKYKDSGYYFKKKDSGGFVLTDASGYSITDAQYEFKDNVSFSLSRSVFNIPELKAGEYYDSVYHEGTLKYLCYGGKQPYTFSIKDGSSLPKGLFIDNKDGTITGMPEEPTEAGNCIVIASDSSSPANTKEITVNYGKVDEKDLKIIVDDTEFLNTESKSGSGWSYDNISKVLTLNNFNGSYIGTNGDLTILLKGSNTLTMKENNGQAYGINTDADVVGNPATVTFVKNSNSSTDKLTIQADYASDSVRLANGRFVLESGSLVLNGKSSTYAIANDSGSFVVKNDANLDVTIDGENDKTSVGLFEIQEDDSSTGTINIRYNSNKGSAVNYFYCYGSGNITISAATGANTAQSLELMKKSGTVKFDGELVLTNGTNTYDINEKAVLTKYKDSGYYFKYRDSDGFVLTDASGNPITDAQYEFKDNVPFSLSRSVFNIPELKVGHDYDSGYYEGSLKYLCYGGKQKYTFKLKEGSFLPKGLEIDSEDGVIFGIPKETSEAGSCIVIASDSSSPANTKEITVTYDKISVDKPVSGLTLSPSTLKIVAGDIAVLTAIVTPENATITDVTFTSKDTKKVQIDTSSISKDKNVTSAKIYSVDAGKTEVTVVTDQGSISKTCAVTVLEKTPEAKLTQENGVLYLTNLEPGAKYLLGPDGSTITQEAVGNGKIKVPASMYNKSIKIIKVNADSDCNSEPQTLTISADLPTAVGISFTGTPVKDGVAATTTDVTLDTTFLECTSLSWTPAPKDGKFVGGEVYTVTAVLKAIEGMSYKNKPAVKINGSVASSVELSDGGKTVTTAYTYPKTSSEVAVTEISISPKEISLTENGSTAEFIVKVLPENATNKNYTVKTADEKIATVKDNKAVNPVQVGKTTLTVTSQDGNKTDTAEVYVRYAKPNAKQNKAKLEVLTPGANYMITPAGGTGKSVTAGADGTVEMEDSWYGTTISIIRIHKDYVQCNSEEQRIQTEAKSVIPSTGLYIAFEGDVEKFTYTGTAIKPNVIVYFNGELLKEPADYSVAYKNNINTGKATVTVTAKGDYSGTGTKDFTIEAADISNAAVIVKAVNETGKESKGTYPKVTATVSYMGKTLSVNKDYKLSVDWTATPEIKKETTTVKGKTTEIEVKLYPVTVTAVTTPSKKGQVINFKGQNTSARIKVYPKGKKPVTDSNYVNLKNGTVEFATGIKSFGYKGFEWKPVVNVYPGKGKNKGEKINSKNYVVDYSPNVNVGTVTVTVTGIETRGYMGTLTTKFTITPLDLKKVYSKQVTVDMPATVEYSKGGAKPAPVISYKVEGRDPIILRENVDYKLSYSGNTKIGGTGKKAPKVTIKGLGNYKSSITKAFAITAKDINKTKIMVTDKAVKKGAKGTYFISKPSVYDENGKKLAEKTDYTVKYYYKDAEINKNTTITEADATIKVVVSGTGAKAKTYTGEAVAYYKVRALKNLSSAKADKIADKQYTGKAIRPDSELKLYTTAGKGASKSYLTLGKDFEIALCYNNVNKGTATYLLRGIGEYSGFKTVTFKIVQAKVKK